MNLNRQWTKRLENGGDIFFIGVWNNFMIFILFLDIPSDMEAASLREENEKLTEVIEDLNLQLLNQHVSR